MTDGLEYKFYVSGFSLHTDRDENQELPRGWAWSRIGDFVDVILGQSPPSSAYNESEVGLPFFQGKLEFGPLHPTVRKWCSEPTKIADKGDVLLSVRAPVGATNIANERCCIGRGLAALRPLANVDSLFILYLLRAFERKIAEQSTGSTFDAITGDRLKRIVVPIPPLPEQNRIIVKIEELITQLDAGVAALEKVQAQVHRYRKAVLEAACDGRLTRRWREAHPELDNASENFLRILAIRKKSSKEVNPETVGIPDNLRYDARANYVDKWTWCQLKDIAIVSLGGTPARKEARYWNGEIPWISSGEVANCRIKSTRECITLDGLANSNAKLYPKGTVLIAMIGEGKTRGQSAILDLEACTNQNVAGLVFDTEEVYPEFIWYWARANYDRTRNSGRGGEQPALNGRIIRGMRIHFPPFVEQHEIVKQIEYLFSIADKVEKTTEISLKQAESLRQSILKQAFEGKLVPQDRRDEPASVLLERIKAEKNISAIIPRKRKESQQSNLVWSPQ